MAIDFQWLLCDTTVTVASKPPTPRYPTKEEVMSAMSTDSTKLSAAASLLTIG